MQAKLLHTFDMGSGIHSLAVAGDGRAVAGLRDGTIAVCDIAGGRKLRSFPTGHGVFLSLAALEDGGHAVSGGLRRLKVWDLESGRLVREIDTSADDVRVLTAGPPGTCLSGHKYGGILIWAPDTGRRLGSLEADEIKLFSRMMADPDEVTALALTSDRQRLVAGSSKGILRVWDLWTRRCLHMLPAHLLDVTGIGVPPGSLRGLSVSWDGAVKGWALEKDATSSALYEGKARIHCLALLPDGNTVVWGTEAGELVFQDVASRALLETVKAHLMPVNRVAAWNGNCVLSASEDGTLKLWGGE